MKFFKYISATTLVMALAACGGGGGSAGGIPGNDGGVTTPVITVPPVTTAPTIIVVPPVNVTASISTIVVTPTSKSLKADGKDAVIFTIQALNSANALVPGAVIDVSVSNNGVILSASSVITGANGAGTISMSANPADQNNRIAVLSTSCSGCAATAVTTQTGVVGASVTLINTSSTLVVGGASATLSATIKDISGVVIVGVPVSFAVTDSKILTVSAASASTNAAGIASVAVAGLGSGTATVNVTALGNAKSQSYTAGIPASTLTVSSPANNFVGRTTNPQTIVVAAAGATAVTFASTRGTFANGQTSQSILVSGGVASANLTVPQSGIASISIADNLGRTAALTLTVSPPVSAANKIILTATQTTLPMSTIDNIRSVSISARAVFFDGISDQPVVDVPIAFSMSGGPGTGEYLDPALQSTNNQGMATATFFAGNTASISNGITITAGIPGKSIVTGTSPSSNDLKMTVGGQALSVAFGPASKLQSSSDETLYIQAYSVQVTDANNNPVSGAVVTLRMSPVAFSTGSACSVAKTYCSEDVNGNGSLDSNEDGLRVLLKNDLTDIAICHPLSPALPPATPVVTKDFLLTPQNSDGGSVPSTVTTDASGTAPFNLTYLKGSALFVINQLTATVASNGTESRKSTIFRLAMSVPDAGPPCSLPPSPYAD